MSLRDIATRLFEISGSMRNFADVADRCTVTEVVNGPPSIRTWAEMLDEIRGELAALAVGGEPVAWEVQGHDGEWGFMHPADLDYYRNKGIPTRPLFTHPAGAVQALGEASGKAYEFSHDLVVVPLHVAQQHFAGLESRCESLARSLQMSEELRATSEGNLIRSAERAECAEARVRELEAKRDSEHE